MAARRREYAALSLWLLATLGAAQPQVLHQCSAESEALQLLSTGWDEDLSADGASADMLFLIRRGWWSAAKELLRLVRAQSPGTDLEPARKYITSLRDDASSTLMLFRVNTAEDTTLSPAFQWAQSWDNVYLNVKFSSRMDGPTTVLNVVNEEVTMTEDTLSFVAVGKDKPKRISLHLTFAQQIDPDVSAGIRPPSRAITRRSCGHPPIHGNRPRTRPPTSRGQTCAKERAPPALLAHDPTTPVCLRAHVRHGCVRAGLELVVRSRRARELHPAQAWRAVSLAAAPRALLAAPEEHVRVVRQAGGAR
jgi:hypothetical protein